ncbi:MAG TPA: M20/M25/M40 family metallo-hydrolase [Candidatus Limnocylindria bacterium]|nr:M20/M25/M40 family metallo-hydrolase [Candidatus Limnocylindria bacterium]
MVTTVDETTELLQQLIRNRCVNDGTPDSGGEVRNAETLAAYLAGPGVEIERYEPHPGRSSLVLRVEGRDRRAPSLLLMGHTDVVPADPTGWQRDPFGGELVAGEVWGRGALDMLCMTATMAVVIKRLLAGGFRPNGTLIFAGVADEESRGTYGASWLTQHAWDAVRADAVLTESGRRNSLPTLGGPKAIMNVAEKGSHWMTLRTNGTPGHGSAPYKADNALAKAADVVRRLVTYKPPLHLDGQWRAFVEGMQFVPELSAGLLSADRFYETIDALPPGVAKGFDALVHTTFSPNVLHGGMKANIIPDSATLQIDIRTLPGDETPQVHAMLREALGELWNEVEIIEENPDPASASSPDTPIFRVMCEVTKKVTGADVVPGSTGGLTDCRFFRRKGMPAYGYSVLSAKIPIAELATMFHGRNERIDQESLRLMLELYEQTVRAYLS